MVREEHSSEPLDAGVYRMTPSEHLALPRPTPPPNIPPSNATVSIRVIDSGTKLSIDPRIFWRPEIKGLSALEAPVFCFLISHGSQHVLFDLGVRSDWENYAPSTVQLIKATTTVQTHQNVSEYLDSDPSDLNIRSADISTLIWSHHHFDHIGDPSTFPPSTTLVVGPGFKTHHQPAHPINPTSPILDSDTANRPVHELDFQTTGLKTGRFPAIDYFHDGSFYLLDAPGHSRGHICALARVTSSPDSFILMTADACHHPGLLRPSPHMPLPRTVGPYSGTALLQKVHPKRSASEPFFMPGGQAFPAQIEAQETLRRIMELDAMDNVFVVLTHDASLKGEMAFFPETVNDWMEKGVKERTKWLFCKDFEGALGLTEGSI